jgi:hypothetical protein
MPQPEQNRNYAEPPTVLIVNQINNQIIQLLAPPAPPPTPAPSSWWRRLGVRLAASWIGAVLVDRALEVPELPESLRQLLERLE